MTELDSHVLIILAMLPSRYLNYSSKLISVQAIWTLLPVAVESRFDRELGVVIQWQSLLERQLWDVRINDHWSSLQAFLKRFEFEGKFVVDWIDVLGRESLQIISIRWACTLVNIYMKNTGWSLWRNSKLCLDALERNLTGRQYALTVWPPECGHLVDADIKDDNDRITDWDWPI